MKPPAVPVSAPGKLFILGEYAVLGGGPALVSTVDRHIRIHPRDDDDGYRINGADFDDPLHLPLLVAQVLREQENITTSANCLTVDVSEFYHQQTKLGLGSSAASTVALIAALAPHLSPQRRFELAWEVHRRLQGGVGSGADIAASTYGGTLAYHLHSVSPGFDDLLLSGLIAPTERRSTDLATIEPHLQFPDSLRIDAVWTGDSAHSVSFVDAVARALQENPDQTTTALQSIASRARAGIRALRDGDADQFVESVANADRSMEHLGAVAELPIITDTHRRIRALAHTTGAVAKPSGAGGGDFTLLVSPADAPLPKPITDDYFVLAVH